MMKKPSIIAVCGKGGVGKTSISAMLAIELAQNPERKILAIDADPSVGLSWPLGMTIMETLNDLRNRLIADIEKGSPQEPFDLVKKLDYQLFESLAERENIALLSIGRPETEGCYCRLNSLLKEVISELTGNFDYVIIDAEAGIEQINRRVLEQVGTLLIVSDPTQRGINVAQSIASVAEKTMPAASRGLIINRLPAGTVEPSLPKTSRLQLLGVIPDDQKLHRFDIEGRDFFQLKESPAREALRSIAEKL
jgi:CO dehydrogenase maturation factor